ncbi:hypothetical protein quinque_007886 [Culex quinquefasciatus]
MTNPTINSFVRPYFEGEKFSFWEERLGYTFAAFDVTEDKVKKAHLALLGGSLLHERLSCCFRQELDSASYEEVITRLTTHFDRPDEWGEVVHHARFHSLVQQPGQTLKQFVRVVKLEAQFCTFGSYAREAIRDRIVVGVRSDDLRNLLLADQHLTLESAERKGEKFSFWEERLGYTFAAFDVTEDKVKKAHLALLGGSLLHERLKLLFPRQELDSASYEEVITRLTTHFDRPDEWGEVVHHARFHSLVQQPGQTLKQFVRVVKLEAQFCTFGSYAREAIRDRIVVGVRSDDLRNLLLADQHLTLESAERKVAIWAMLNKS